MLREGTMTLTIDQNPERQARNAVNLNSVNLATTNLRPIRPIRRRGHTSLSPSMREKILPTNKD
jgi:hypothetical protein